jgi:hypothetical protein
MLIWQPLHAMTYVAKVGALGLSRTSCFIKFYWTRSWVSYIHIITCPHKMHINVIFLVLIRGGGHFSTCFWRTVWSPKCRTLRHNDTPHEWNSGSRQVHEVATRIDFINMAWRDYHKTKLNSTITWTPRTELAASTERNAVREVGWKGQKRKW